MNPDAIVTLGVIAVTVFLLVTEKVSYDLVALAGMAVLALSGVLTPSEALLGFANEALITVGAMFVLSAALTQTGAIEIMEGPFRALLKRHPLVALAFAMLAVACLSAFVNNTAAVAILIPLVIRTCRGGKMSPSKLLMPLSYASMFGGMCTLIGTSTNMLASSVLAGHGQPPISMFELLPLGAIFLAVGTAYMSTLGVRLIPERRPPSGLADSFGMGPFVTSLVVVKGGPLEGKTIGDIELLTRAEVAVLELSRSGKASFHPEAASVLQGDDILRVKCPSDVVSKLQAVKGLVLRPTLWREGERQKGNATLVEAIVSPDSYLQGKTIRQVRFGDLYGGTVLALRHHGHVVPERIDSVPLRSGDTLLIEIAQDRLDLLRREGLFLVVSELSEVRLKPGKAVLSILTMVAVVLTATVGLVPVVVSSVAGAVLVTVSGCIEAEKAYQSVSWKVLFLLAGLLALGMAMEKTGLAALAARQLLAVGRMFGPEVILSILFLLTLLLTELLSNNATVLLLAPIALATAGQLQCDPRPFVLAVAVAASSSFMTPIGYQTNTMIYGPGQYRFSDFVRAGAPLNLLFWLLGSYFIPRIWPLLPV